MITPIKKQVLVKRLETQYEIKQTASGVYYGYDYKKRDDMTVQLAKGEVIAVGNECDAAIKPGVKVVYNPFDAHDFTEGETELALVNSDVISAVMV